MCVGCGTVDLLFAHTHTLSLRSLQGVLVAALSQKSPCRPGRLSCFFGPAVFLSALPPRMASRLLPALALLLCCPGTLARAA